MRKGAAGGRGPGKHGPGRRQGPAVAVQEHPAAEEAPRSGLDAKDAVAKAADGVSGAAEALLPGSDAADRRLPRRQPRHPRQHQPRPVGNAAG